ncbi:hypothetical protein AZI86_08255 [Bdellovibrio bacteriovorus]|uniref:Uncharacterized protein n=1 Tax=Bdellovibrio bacteriovorus TaxID=959 RepID=A0A150WR83_BDEBC|nr:hypothetical protein [Bdellovibrio bacteriovorus]KYG67003.1 hypothetical protein AZI86_08255 [Bdellovibrio bacteriovorus]
MKALILVLTTTLTMTSFAHADNQCAFGEDSWELKEEITSEASGKLWYHGETIELSSPQRLKGLTDLERQMIIDSYSIGEPESESEQLLDFVKSDGYITYFTPNSYRRQFAIVASYPGDNEYGVIFEIRQGPKDALIAIPVATIGDGELGHCKVLKSDIK